MIWWYDIRKKLEEWRLDRWEQEQELKVSVHYFIFKDSAVLLVLFIYISSDFVWMVLSNTGIFLHGQFKSMWKEHNLASALSIQNDSWGESHIIQRL